MTRNPGISVNSFKTHCTCFALLEYDTELWRPLVLLELLEDCLSLAVDELQRRLEDGRHRVAVVHSAGIFGITKKAVFRVPMVLNWLIL